MVKYPPDRDRGHVIHNFRFQPRVRLLIGRHRGSPRGMSLGRKLRFRERRLHVAQQRPGSGGGNPLRPAVVGWQRAGQRAPELAKRGSHVWNFYR